MSEWYISHGVEWKNHKYLKKIGNRYIYAKDMIKKKLMPKKYTAERHAQEDKKYNDKTTRDMIISKMYHASKRAEPYDKAYNHGNGTISKDEYSKKALKYINKAISSKVNYLDKRHPIVKGESIQKTRDGKPAFYVNDLYNNWQKNVSESNQMNKAADKRLDKWHKNQRKRKIKRGVKKIMNRVLGR